MPKIPVGLRFNAESIEEWKAWAKAHNVSLTYAIEIAMHNLINGITIQAPAETSIVKEILS